MPLEWWIFNRITTNWWQQKYKWNGWIRMNVTQKHGPPKIDGVHHWMLQHVVHKSTCRTFNLIKPLLCVCVCSKQVFCVRCISLSTLMLLVSVTQCKLNSMNSVELSVGWLFFIFGSLYSDYLYKLHLIVAVAVRSGWKWKCVHRSQPSDFFENQDNDVYFSFSINISSHNLLTHWQCFFDWFNSWLDLGLISWNSNGTQKTTALWMIVIASIRYYKWFTSTLYLIPYFCSHSYFQ